MRAYLVADDSKWGDIKWKKYGDGERVLVDENWDNLNDAAYASYDFAIETP